jgi:hypothetical protein
VRACASRNWPIFRGVGGRNHWQITHEPRTYHLQSLTNHWHIAYVDANEQRRCSIPRTSYARPTHESLTEHVQIRTLRERSTYKHFRSVIVSGCQWNERNTCAVHARYEREASVDVRGFEPIPTHKHWRPTRVPRIVTHTRRINYARWLMNYAHRRTVVRRKNFETFKTQNHAQTAFDAHPLTITDSPRSFHRRITHTTHAPRRNENMCVIRAWFMRFRCVTGPLNIKPYRYSSAANSLNDKICWIVFKIFSWQFMYTDGRTRWIQHTPLTTLGEYNKNQKSKTIMTHPVNSKLN